MKTPKQFYDERKAKKAAEKAAKQIEQEKASVRKPEFLMGEYKRLCQILGDKYYRSECFKAECQAICEDIFKMNQEFDKAKQLHGPELPKTNGANSEVLPEQSVQNQEPQNEASH